MDQFVAVGSHYRITTFTVPPNCMRSKIIQDSFASSLSGLGWA